MGLKQEKNRPTPRWLVDINPTNLQDQSFPLSEALQNSLYYPAAGTDGRPVQFLGGFIHSFFYVDYGSDQQFIDQEVLNRGFQGYTVSGRKELSVTDLVPEGWFPVIPPKFDKEVHRYTQHQLANLEAKPFATWFIFDRDQKHDSDYGPDRFSFVYICADASAAYQALYWKNQTSPEVLAIIQPGNGEGFNFMDLKDPDGFFAWTVMNNNGLQPAYLVCGGNGLSYQKSFWPEEYSEHVEWFERENGNGVWRRPA